MSVPLYEEWGCEGSGALSCWWKFALHFLAAFFLVTLFIYLFINKSPVNLLASFHLCGSSRYPGGTCSPHPEMTHTG